MSDLYIEVTALKVKNCGGPYSSDQVVFVCPYCKRRNKQNIRLAVEKLQSGKVASFRCSCSHLVYVRRPISGRSLLLPGDPAHNLNRLVPAGAAVGEPGQRIQPAHGQSIVLR